MFFVKKEKKKSHFWLKAMLFCAGVGSTVCLCGCGMKKLGKKCKKIADGIRMAFRKAKDRGTPADV